MRALTPVFLCLVFLLGAAAAQQEAKPATPAAEKTKKPTESGGVPPIPADVPKNATRYAILIGGNLAGHQLVWSGPQGRRHVLTQFNDRGRGPQIRTVIGIGRDGLPVLIENSGHDYLKGPVEERYSLEGGLARWKNKAEEGERKVNGPVFFPSFYGPPYETTLMVKALLKSGKPMPLLPEGEARAERVRELKLTSGGKSQAVELIAVSGFSFAPFYLWVDGNQELFAAGGRWFMTIREGWEGTQEQLSDAQDAAENEHLVAIARRVTRKPKGEVVFRNVNVFDSSSGKVTPGQTVVVRGKKIASVGASAEVGPEAEVIDGSGATLLPGLIDMHAHVGSMDGLLNIAAGVTTVRDLANVTEELELRRQRYDRNEEVGTRIFAAGFMDGPGPFQGPTKVLVDTPEKVRDAVGKYAALGYQQIKLYSSIKPELVPVIIAEAHKHGMRVSGHVPATMFADQFIRQGGDELQHINFVFLNFFRDVTETRTPARFLEPAKRAAGLDLESPEVKQFVSLLRERKIVVDPTVSIFESMFTSRPGELDPAFAAVARRMPTQMRRGFLAGGLPVDESNDQTYRRSFQKMLDMVALLHRSGVQIVPGTDTLAGFGLHRELELYNRAGIPAAEVLQIATLRSAQVLKRDSELGSIAPGKLADLVLVEGDPTQDISNIRRTRMVMKDGLLFDPKAIYQDIGVQP